MSDYIDRQELIENLKKFAPEHYTGLIDDLIRKQPAADVRPIVRGEWENEPVYDDPLTPYSTCKNCGKYVMAWNFCPNCGADNRG